MNRPAAFGTRGMKRSGRSGCRRVWEAATADGGRRGRKKQIVSNKGLPLHRAPNWMSGPSSPTSHVLLTSQCTGWSCDPAEGSDCRETQDRTSSAQQLHSCVQPAAALVKSPIVPLARRRLFRRPAPFPPLPFPPPPLLDLDSTRCLPGDVSELERTFYRHIYFLLAFK